MTDTIVPWTTVVSKGLLSKVIVPIATKRDSTSKTEVLTSTIVYEDPDITKLLLAQKASSIVQQSLTKDSVLFCFPSSLFEHRALAYKLIEDQISADVDGFRTISNYSNRISKDLLVEVKFRKEADGVKAIDEGVEVNGLVYQASPSEDGATRNLVRVQLDLLHIPNKSTFLAELMKSLSNYGKVCQVKQFFFHNYFEGKVSVLLDVGDENKKKYQPLTRMIWLEEWDVYVPAQFKGADPVCYYCRQYGHIKQDCPKLAGQACFRCHQTGHTKRFCKVPASEIEVLRRSAARPIQDNKNGSTTKEIKATEGHQHSVTGVGGSKDSKYATDSSSSNNKKDEKMLEPVEEEDYSSDILDEDMFSDSEDNDEDMDNTFRPNNTDSAPVLEEKQGLLIQSAKDMLQLSKVTDKTRRMATTLQTKATHATVTRLLLSNKNKPVTADKPRAISKPSTKTKSSHKGV